MTASKNILHADDSVFFRAKFGDILKEAGLNVKSVNDGREATVELAANPGAYDLLILDLQMPELDGFGVLLWLRDNGFRGKLPVLVATGAFEPAEVLDRLRGHGADGIISKEAEPEQLIERVRMLLERG